MESDVNIDVASLDQPHRKALEEVIGQELAVSQRLIISVIDVSQPAGDAARPSQKLEDWTGVYEGLTEQEIEAIDEVAKTRADLTRDVTHG
jgi:hypothetical protein